MSISVITQKGQTTIPKDIRDHLHLQLGDKVVFVRDGDRVYIHSIKGNILDTAKAFKRVLRRPVDFKSLRAKATALVAKKAGR